MSLRIAIVGAGSRSFGPAMIRDLLLSDPLAEQGLELVLMDARAEHLTANADYASRVAEQLGRRVALSTTTDLDEALADARFVVTAFEVDRYTYWSQDFHVPRKYGFKQVYGENGGPGGLFHALRNFGPILAIAEAMGRHCPEALLLNFSNPEHKLCEAVSRLTDVQAVGLCHGVYGGQNQIAEILGLPVERLRTRACGINHFTFFTTIEDRESGEDLYPRLREAEREARWTTHWHELALGRVMLRVFGLWPSPGTNHYGEYVRWAGEFMASELHFYYDALEGEPWVTGNLPDFVYTIDRAATGGPWRPEPPAPAAPPSVENLRRSGEFAVPIIESLVTGTEREILAVNVTNRGAMPNLPAEMVVEVPAIASGAGLEAVAMDPLPEGIACLLRTQASINQLLIEAYAERSRMKLLQALLLDPTVDSYQQAVRMMDELIALQGELLPELV